MNNHNYITAAIGGAGTLGTAISELDTAIIIMYATVSGIIINTLINWLRYMRDK